MAEYEKKESMRFIAKVKAQNSSNGVFNKILVDNPNPTDEAGQPNQYYQGNLFWVDSKTGKTYLVKQLGIKGVSQNARKKGYLQSITIDLEDSYQTTEQ